MELEEMQAAWTQMSNQLDEQKKLTDDIIMQMTQEKFSKQWNTIGAAEKVGTVISYIAAIVLLFHFNKLDTPLLQACGVLCVLILFIAPILSLRSIYGLQSISVADPYSKMMERYATAKKRFVNFQKANMIMSFFFMLLTIPVSGKLFNDENLFETLDSKLLIALPFCFLFFFLLIRYVTKCYRGVLKRSEDILNEIEDK
tara:strand:+ start:137080 stop:137679 length:600 start_codon:yes stop_codon:yes gene_type:complete